MLRDAPAPAIAVWNELRIELNVGQYLDVAGHGARANATAGRRAHRAIQVGQVHRRAAAPRRRRAWPRRLDELARAAVRLRHPLGEAFQLRDDLLGAFGDETLTGKPVGDDLREGKPTTLLAIATARATGSDAANSRVVGASDLGDDEVEAIQRVLQRTGAREELEAQISALADEAIAALDCVPFVDEALVALAELAALRGQANSVSASPSVGHSRTPGSFTTASSQGGRQRVQTTIGVSVGASCTA